MQISADLAKWLDGQNLAKWLEHVRGAPYHPMTQGKIERWHQDAQEPYCPSSEFLGQAVA